VLRYVDEVRFGPAYYTLALGAAEATPGTSVYFGDLLEFSPDGRMLVVLQWSGTREPDTTAVVIDCEERRTAALLHIGRGYVERIDFRADRIVVLYRRFDGRAWQNLVDEVSFASLEWAPATWWRNG
jgi:hypothetical protein